MTTQDEALITTHTLPPGTMPSLATGPCVTWLRNDRGV